MYPKRIRSSSRAGRPSMRTSPASGASTPITMRIAVVLPAPFGPRNRAGDPPRRRTTAHRGRGDPRNGASVGPAPASCCHVGALPLSARLKHRFRSEHHGRLRAQRDAFSVGLCGLRIPGQQDAEVACRVYADGPRRQGEVDDDDVRRRGGRRPCRASRRGSTRTRSSRGSRRSGALAPQRDQVAVPRQQARVRLARELVPVQPRALERLGACGSGTSSSAQPCSANSARRPRRTASAIAGSVWSVKYIHGVEAPHSSPMKSIGVPAPSAAARRRTASRPGESVGRQPVAQRAVADLVVRLQRDDEARARQRRAVDRARRACARGTTTTCRRGRRCPRAPSRARPARRSRRSSPASRRSARRAARGGRRRPTAPSMPEPPRARGGHRERVVAVGLGDQPERPAEPAESASTSAASSSSSVIARSSKSACTASRRSAVDVEVAQPHERVVDEEAPHLVAAGAVEVDGVAPRRPVAVGEVRAELAAGSCRSGRGGCRRRRGRRRGRARGRRRRSAGTRTARRRARARRTARRRRSPSRAGRGSSRAASPRRCRRRARRGGRGARSRSRACPRA